MLALHVVGAGVDRRRRGRRRTQIARRAAHEHASRSSCPRLSCSASKGPGSPVTSPARPRARSRRGCRLASDWSGVTLEILPPLATGRPPRRAAGPWSSLQAPTAPAAGIGDRPLACAGHGLGLLDRAGVRGEARVDARTSSATRSSRSRRSTSTGHHGFLRRSSRRSRSEVKGRGLWAAHLPPELGGQGFGQVKLALMHEILGACDVRAAVFGNQAPDSGNSELLALGGDATSRRSAGCSRCSPARCARAFSMTEQGTGSDPTQLTRPRRARRRRVGDQRAQVVHRQRRSPTSRSSWP